ncbi:hypothetical protein [Marinomonas sp. THO17]|uniref:hypothetical protein n=1 Tax=Marinomonas sp. THO17 TaxID=3149048 RepID=UPI00336C2812
MPLVCIDGTTVAISVDGPQVLAKTSDTVPSSTQNTLKVGGKSALLEADVADWLAGYATDYDNPPYAGGKAQGDTITGVSALTANSVSSAEIVKSDTVFNATLSVTTPGDGPNGSKDPVSTINIIVEITDPAQTQLKAT